MTRIIRKSRARANIEVARLLEALFVAELTSPSRCIWIVSPWISDVPLIDNSAGSYDPLEACGWRPVRLSEVLVTLAEAGTHLVLAAGDDPTNRPFLTTLSQLFDDRQLRDQIDIKIEDVTRLHEKALTADDYVVSGSMNFTFSGIFFREELVELHTEPELVAAARTDVFERFGGVL